MEENSTSGKEVRDESVDATELVDMIAEQHDTQEQQEHAVWCRFLKSRGYWTPIVKTVKFVLHFTVVILLLFVGALIFATIEDPKLDSAETRGNTSKINNEQAITDMEGEFWMEINTVYKVNVTGNTRDAIRNKFESYIAEKRKQEEKKKYEKENKNRKYIFLKWLYFVTITATTIGYGDVTPKTDAGKMFTLAFMVIGIIVIMTLLASSGAIITALNKKCYRFVIQRVCRGNDIVREELVSAVTIILLFVLFLTLGIWYHRMVGITARWTLVDTIYYWMVTFSTVGYGDKLIPLETEVEHIVELLVFRVFGLAFIAGIIDSLHAYFNIRKEELRRQARRSTRSMTPF